GQRPLRVLFLIDSLGPGGAESLMVPYLRYLASAGFETRVCALQAREGNPVAAEIHRLGVPVDRLRVRRLRNPLALPRVLGYVRRVRPDIVHTQLEFANVLGTLAARLARVPAVSTLHTLDEPDQGSRARIHFGLMTLVLRHFADRVIAVSEAVRRHSIARARLQPERVITLNNGVDLARYLRPGGCARPEVRAELQIPENARLLATVAVLRPEKGIQHLIDALPRILERVPDAAYLVIGDGDHRQALERLARDRGIVSRVIFTGYRNDVPRLLAAADLFVLPTLTEALPTVLAEAMAAGLPIVATAVGGVPEMVEHGNNGLLVPPARPDLLGAACIRLLTDRPQAEAMALRGRRIAGTRFNVQAQAARLAWEYRRLAGRTTRQGAS
ncbi:MAG: glycosyltransferase, partial [Acidimicrobiia bacterium]